MERAAVKSECRTQTDTLTPERLEFAIFCLENVADSLKRPAPEVFDLWTKESDILYGYILPCYDALHTQGKEYVVEDILEVMREEGLNV